MKTTEEIVTNLDLRQQARKLARHLSDNALKILLSEVRKETLRRKVIHNSNASWTANEGLEVMLRESLQRMFKDVK